VTGKDRKGTNKRSGKGGWGSRASGEGPDEAEVKGWAYKGRHQELPGGSGLFHYTDRQGNDKTAHRFTLKKKS